MLSKNRRVGYRSLRFLLQQLRKKEPYPPFPSYNIHDFGRVFLNDIIKTLCFPINRTPERLKSNRKHIIIYRGGRKFCNRSVRVREKNKAEPERKIVLKLKGYASSPGSVPRHTNSFRMKTNSLRIHNPKSTEIRILAFI